MRRITMIEFSPQNEDDTLEAIEIAKTILNTKEDVLLKPTTVLIDTECLTLLTQYKFYIRNTMEYGKVFEKRGN